MSQSSVELSAPLPHNAQRATLTWTRGQGPDRQATGRQQADGASLHTVNSLGIEQAVTFTLAEADAYLAEVDRLHGGRGGPAPEPIRPAPSAPAPSGASRSTCSNCGSARTLVGPRNLVHIENLDDFYRKQFDPALLAVTTVYDYECPTCHSLEQFSTPR